MGPFDGVHHVWWHGANAGPEMLTIAAATAGTISPVRRVPHVSGSQIFDDFDHTAQEHPIAANFVTHALETEALAGSALYMMYSIEPLTNTDPHPPGGNPPVYATNLATFIDVNELLDANMAAATLYAPYRAPNHRSSDIGSRWGYLDDTNPLTDAEKPRAIAFICHARQTTFGASQTQLEEFLVDIADHTPEPFEGRPLLIYRDPRLGDDTPLLDGEIREQTDLIESYLGRHHYVVRASVPGTTDDDWHLAAHMVQVLRAHQGLGFTRGRRLRPKRERGKVRHQ